MALPIGDDNSDRRITPVVNYLLIAINVFAFIYWQKWGANVPITFAYAAVPGEIITNTDIVTNSELIKDPVTGELLEMPGLQETPVPVFLTLVTSMFLHGGIAHLFGNMLFLLIFGDNVEDKLGHIKYILFYFLCGILAGLSHVTASVVLDQNLLIPSLGASGAISGVLAAYILLFPHRGVHVWIFFFVVTLPAFIVVGMWFVFQVLNGMGSLGGQETGGVAYAAHIGGFIAGLLLIKKFLPADKRRNHDSFYRRR